MAACALVAYAVIRSDPAASLEKARTAAFVVLACSQLFHSLNCRNLRVSLFEIGPLGNPKLLAAIAFSFLIQVMVVTVPMFRGWFKTEALSGQEWAWMLLISSIPLWAVEFYKAVLAKIKEG